jgi:hypothetical protein
MVLSRQDMPVFNEADAKVSKGAPVGAATSFVRR